MKTSEIVFGALRVPLDVLAVILAITSAYHLRLANIDLIPGVQLLEPPTTLPSFEHFLRTFTFWATITFIVLAAGLRLYMLRLTMSWWREVARVVIAAIFWIALVIAWYFLVEKQLFYSRMLLVHAAFLIVLFVLLGRGCMLLVQRALLRRGIGVRAVLSLGAQQLPASVEEVLRFDVRYHYLGHLHDPAALRRKHASHAIDLVVHTDAQPDNRVTEELIAYCRSQHIGYAFLPAMFCDVPQQLLILRIGFVPVLRFMPTPLDGWGRVSKRLFDIIASAMLLIALSPLLALLAVLVLLLSGWPILYVSTRIGQFAKRDISMLKFRTMLRDADARKEHMQHLSHRRDGPLFKVKDDPRVTPLGRVLRRWTLDELPQLLNVFVGNMSLVGPRPHLPDEVRKYSEYQRRVFAVKPGMTGLAQISGRSDLNFEEEVRLDLQYVEEWSLLLDLWILWRTVFVVIGKKGAD